jgi:cell division protein FtsB
MKADSTQPIATPVRYDRNQGACLDKFGLMMFKLMGWCSAVNSVDEAHQLGEQMVERINSHAALTQQVADLQAENARLDAQVERLSVEIGRLNDELHSTQPIATPVERFDEFLASQNGCFQNERPCKACAVAFAASETAALTQQVADLKAEVARLKDGVANLCAKTERIELAAGHSIAYQDGHWWYFDNGGEGVVSGDDPLEVLSKALAGEKHDG